MSFREFWLYGHFFSILHAVLVLIFLSHLFRQRKSPSSTLAWFFLVVLAPYIGFAIYIIFGTRKYKVLHPRTLPHSSFVHLTDPLQRILATCGGPSVSSATQIELIESGEKAFDVIVSQIRLARRSIDLETYIFSSDEVGQLILTELIAAAKRGVAVRILLDALGAKLPGHPSFKELMSAGGKVSYFMPILHMPFKGRANLRNHRKILVIDQQIAIIGGMNVATDYMGPTPDPKRWVDLAMTLHGDVVNDLFQIFLQDWAFVTGQAVPAALPSPPVREKNHALQVIPSGPNMKSDPIYEALLVAIYGARKQISIVTPYFVPDDSLAKALELAARRGVNVRVIVPQKSNHKLADLTRRTYIQQIQEAGASVLYFKKMIHAKAVLIDDTYAIVGSANMDNRSLLLNYELGICFFAQADQIKLQQWFERQAESCSLLGAPPRWSDEWVSGIARLLGPLL